MRAPGRAFQRAVAASRDAGALCRHASVINRSARQVRHEAILARYRSRRVRALRHGEIFALDSPDSDKSAHVLIVSDDSDGGRVVARILRVAGFRVSHAWEHSHVRHLLRSSNVDLVLLDLGFEYRGLAVLDDTVPGVPVIAITAPRQPLHDGRLAAILRKPFSVDNLIEVVAVHAWRRDTTN